MVKCQTMSRLHETFSNGDKSAKVKHQTFCKLCYTDLVMECYSLVQQSARKHQRQANLALKVASKQMLCSKPHGFVIAIPHVRAHLLLKPALHCVTFVIIFGSKQKSALVSAWRKAIILPSQIPVD